MKITFKEILDNKKEWIHEELLESVPSEVINKSLKDQFYDVKLLVNGIELEPLYFKRIMDNIEKHIDNEAKSIVLNKLEKSQNSANELSDIVFDAIEKIKNTYNL